MPKYTFTVNVDEAADGSLTVLGTGMVGGPEVEYHAAPRATNHDDLLDVLANYVLRQEEDGTVVLSHDGQEIGRSTEVAERSITLADLADVVRQNESRINSRF